MTLQSPTEDILDDEMKAAEALKAKKAFDNNAVLFTFGSITVGTAYMLHGHYPALFPSDKIQSYVASGLCGVATSVFVMGSMVVSGKIAQSVLDIMQINSANARAKAADISGMVGMFAAAMTIMSYKDEALKIVKDFQSEKTEKVITAEKPQPEYKNAYMLK